MLPTLRLRRLGGYPLKSDGVSVRRVCGWCRPTVKAVDIESAPESGSVLDDGAVTLDFARGEVTFDGKPVALDPCVTSHGRPSRRNLIDIVGRGVTYNQMVADALHGEKQTDRLFFALSDTTRRDIVSRALDRERSVSELGRLYPISLTAVQKHVDVLVDAGLVSKHRSGREQLVRGEVDQLRRAHELINELETVWRARLERFEDVLNETTGKEGE
jgi:DNA-binding transcriptional ArsR family regulator